MATTRIRLIVTVLLCTGIVVLGWLLGAAPQLEARALSLSDRAAVDVQNAVHRARVAELKVQFERIETTRTDLAQLRQGMPAAISAPDFLDQVAATAAAHSVTVASFSAQEAMTPIVAAAPIPVDAAAAAVPPAATPTEATPVADVPAVPPATTTATTASPLLGADNFFVVPVTFSLTGSASDVRAMIADLQSGPRLFLLSSITIAAGDGSGVATGQAPLTGTSSLSGFIYVVSSTPAQATGEAILVN